MRWGSGGAHRSSLSTVGGGRRRLSNGFGTAEASGPEWESAIAELPLRPAWSALLSSIARNLTDSENVVFFLRGGRGAGTLAFSSLSDQGSGAGSGATCGSRLLERSGLEEEPAAEEEECPEAIAIEPFIGGQDFCRGSCGPPGSSYGGGGGGEYERALLDAFAAALPGVMTTAGVPPV